MRENKYGTCVSIGLKKPQSLAGLIEGIHLWKSVRTGGDDCYFKCKDRYLNFK